MASILEIAKKSQEYVDNINDNIDRVINSVEQKLTDLNREQMFFHKGGDDKDLIHVKTGSKYLSKAYAKKTNKSRPDIFVTGAFQKEMQLYSEYVEKEYTVASDHWLQDYLPDNYKNLLGIAPSYQPSAHAITSKAIAEDYNNKVLT